MNSILRRISDFVFSVPARGLAREAHYLRKAIIRTESSIDEMISQTPAGACCPNCHYGMTYAELAMKLDRQKQRLFYIEGKLGDRS
jgi:hypothetical protein